MADYSIGDRVEVRWEAELFDAAVIEVHPSGKVDVVYDIDGSVGLFLTAKEHGLKFGGGGKEGGEKEESVLSWRLREQSLLQRATLSDTWW